MTYDVNDVKFKVGGHPPAGLLRGNMKWQQLYAELDEIELNVWARAVMPDKKTAQNALQAARKYLRPRNIKVTAVIDERPNDAVLWIRKVDTNR